MIARLLLALALICGLVSQACAQWQTNAVPCSAAAIYDASTNGSTQLVTANETGGIQVCGYILFGGGTANVKLIYGTGTACATGTVNLTPAFALVAQAQVNDTSPFFRGLYVPPGNNLCINTSAGVAIQAVVYVNKIK
jgi:hypothetical protein